MMVSLRYIMMVMQFKIYHDGQFKTYHDGQLSYHIVPGNAPEQWLTSTKCIQMCPT